MEYKLYLQVTKKDGINFDVVNAERVPPQGEEISFPLNYPDFEELIKKRKISDDPTKVRELYNLYQHHIYKVEKVSSRLKVNGKNLETDFITVKAKAI